MHGEESQTVQNVPIYMPLISKSVFPPGGWWYYEAKTSWPKDAKSYFAGNTYYEVRDKMAVHRTSNPLRFTPEQCTPEACDADLEKFTCLRLANNPNYCSGGAAVPQGGASKKGIRQTFATIRAASVGAAAAAKKVVAGAGVLLDWLGDGAKPVSQELANKRAEICSTCPQNVKTDLTSFFTVPAANMIRQQIEIRGEMKLSTPFDAKLGICQACACPLTLKPHVQLSYILKKLSPEVRAKLDPRCWMNLETP